MARIKLGALINDISGRIGTLIFAKWKGLAYVRGAAMTVDNPQTPAQAEIRAALAELSKLWFKTLTPEERVNWETYAEELGSSYDDVSQSNGGQGVINPPGRVMSGYNAFVANNIRRASIGYDVAGSFVSDAPIGEAPPTPPLNVNALWDPETACILLSYDKPLEPGPTRTYENLGEQEVVENPIVRVWMQRTGSYAMINQLNEIPGNGAPNEECICEIPEYGLLKPLPPGTYAVQLDAVSPSGQVSPPSNQVTVVVPDCCSLPAIDPTPASQYAAPSFIITIAKTILDSACPADFVKFTITDTNGIVETWNIPRAEWDDQDPNYDVFVYWVTPTPGTYQIFIQAGTYCGKYSLNLRLADVVIP